MPPKLERRKVIKTMSQHEIQNEIDDIYSVLSHVEPDERAKLRVRLKNLEKALDEEEGDEGASASAGAGGRKAATKRKLVHHQVDEKIDAINAAIRHCDLLGRSAADLEEMRDKKQPKRQAVEVVDLVDDDEVEVLEIDDDAPPYEPVSTARGAGEADLEYLGRLVRSRAQLHRAIERLRTEHEIAAERAAASAARFVKEDREMQHQFETLERELQGFQNNLAVQRQQDLVYKNVEKHYVLKQAYKRETEELASIQRETFVAIEQREHELVDLSGTINNMQVKKDFRRAIMDRYPDKTIVGAWEAFVDHFSFNP